MRGPYFDIEFSTKFPYSEMELSALFPRYFLDFYGFLDFSDLEMGFPFQSKETPF